MKDRKARAFLLIFKLTPNRETLREDFCFPTFSSRRKQATSWKENNWRGGGGVPLPLCQTHREQRTFSSLWAFPCPARTARASRPAALPALINAAFALRGAGHRQPEPGGCCRCSAAVPSRAGRGGGAAAPRGAAGGGAGCLPRPGMRWGAAAGPGPGPDAGFLPPEPGEHLGAGPGRPGAPAAGEGREEGREPRAPGPAHGGSDGGGGGRERRQSGRGAEHGAQLPPLAWAGSGGSVAGRSLRLHPLLLCQESHKVRLGGGGKGQIFPCRQKVAVRFPFAASEENERAVPPPPPSKEPKLKPGRSGSVSLPPPFPGGRCPAPAPPALPAVCGRAGPCGAARYPSGTRSCPSAGLCPLPRFSRVLLGPFPNGFA